jgi:hypothetical protein
MSLGVEEVHAGSFYCNPPHVDGKVLPRDGFESYGIHISDTQVRTDTQGSTSLLSEEMTYVEKNPAARPKNCSTEIPRALSANGKSSTR